MPHDTNACLLTYEPLVRTTMCFCVRPVCALISPSKPLFPHNSYKADSPQHSFSWSCWHTGLSVSCGGGRSLFFPLFSTIFHSSFVYLFFFCDSVSSICEQIYPAQNGCENCVRSVVHRFFSFFVVGCRVLALSSGWQVSPEVPATITIL